MILTDQTETLSLKHLMQVKTEVFSKRGFWFFCHVTHSVDIREREQEQDCVAEHTSDNTPPCLTPADMQ